MWAPRPQARHRGWALRVKRAQQIRQIGRVVREPFTLVILSAGLCALRGGFHLKISANGRSTAQVVGWADEGAAADLPAQAVGAGSVVKGVAVLKGEAGAVGEVAGEVLTAFCIL